MHHACQGVFGFWTMDEPPPARESRNWESRRVDLFSWSSRRTPRPTAARTPGVDLSRLGVGALRCKAAPGECHVAATCHGRCLEVRQRPRQVRRARRGRALTAGRPGVGPLLEQKCVLDRGLVYKLLDVDGGEEGSAPTTQRPLRGVFQLHWDVLLDGRVRYARVDSLVYF